MEKKSNTYFDADAYEKFCNKVGEYSVQIIEAVNILMQEGIDASVKELMTYPARFPDIADDENKNAYKSHFVSLYKQAEKRAGWLPLEERQRMFDNFIAVYKRTHRAVITIISALNYGCILEESAEGVGVNIEATQEKNRERFMIPIDADAMKQHWDMLKTLRDKMDELKRWEMEHGLPVLGLPNAFDFGAFAYYVNNVELTNGERVMLTEEKHASQVWKYFTSK